MTDRRLLVTVRYVIPALIVAGGVLPIVLTPTVDMLEAAIHIIAAGLSVLLLNVLWRIGVSGDHERDDEDVARHYHELFGVWPDEDVAERRAERRRLAADHHRGALGVAHTGAARRRSHA